MRTTNEEWSDYHKSERNLKEALEKHLANIDRVYVYDNTNNDGDYECAMEDIGAGFMRNLLNKLTKKEYNKNNLNWVYQNDTWVDLNSDTKLTRRS